MSILNLGTLLKAGRGPAASTRAITPMAELPWRT
jgi:hypothetical protein